MRAYGSVSPMFWTRGSGKRLRGDYAAQIVALYLMTSPHTTMVGIFHLSLPTLCHETGLSTEEASKGLARCSKEMFAFWDEAEELVFVPALAHHQLGERLNKKDHKVKGVLRALAPFKGHRFFDLFLERYADLYSLSEGASKSLRRDDVPVPDPDHGSDPGEHERGNGSPDTAPPPTKPDPLMNPEETVMPSGLRERALEPNNAVDHLTRTLKVPRAVIVAELESFCRYREAGKGMGDKRPYWIKHFRQHVLDRADRGQLKPIGAVEHAATSETVDRDARKQRNNALLAAAAAGDYGPDAQETARSGSKPDKAKLLSDIGNGLVRRIRAEPAGLGEVLEQIRQEAS